ncbi:MAG: SPOR domain-containing protein [Bacteroidales bacterium]|nr:SPOR domain-containing protein [Bacteroidales bacterium]
MKHFFFLTIIFLFSSSAFAQTSRLELAQTGLFGQSYSGSQAKIYINADTKLFQIIKLHKQQSEGKTQIRGWRIRVYMGSGRNARDEANNAKMKIRNYFPDIEPHMVHHSPYFQVVVGDFRSRIEAEAYRKKMLDKFPDCYVVESKITLNN